MPLSADFASRIRKRTRRVRLAGCACARSLRNIEGHLTGDKHENCPRRLRKARTGTD